MCLVDAQKEHEHECACGHLSKSDFKEDIKCEN